MKISRKLLVLSMAAVLAAVSFIPSTFSWYTHNGESQGNKINYVRDDLPVSVKSAANTVTATTYIADQNGIATSEVVSGGLSVAPDAITHQAVKYYKTVFENTGSNDVMIDFETNHLKNNSDFVFGTVSTVVNEKVFASRAVRSKVTNNTVRIYFKTNSSMSSYWSKNNGSLVREKGTYLPDSTTHMPSDNTQQDTEGTQAGGSVQTGSSGTNNDINLSYTVNGKEVQVKMEKCSKADTSTDYNVITNSNTGSNVYFYDIPSSTTSFFFFNHWYLRSTTNREWNRTKNITDVTQGKLYYLTGNTADGNYKEYLAKPVDTDLVALNQYYNNVRMSIGSSVFADIGLKKTSDTADENFVPDYYGSKISYTSANTSNVTVSSFGLVTPLRSGTATNITTTIEGKFGDTKTVTTKVDIPEYISEIPIIKNLRVPAQGTTTPEGKAANRVEVDWYVINKSATDTLTTDALYCTI